MTTTKLIAAAVAATFILGAGAAMAAERTAASIECSKQADAKGLHGKERKKFRAHCKHEVKKEEKK
jgi:psiF repeat